VESLSPIMSVQVRLRRDRFKEISKTESDTTPMKNHGSPHSFPKKLSVGDNFCQDTAAGSSGKYRFMGFCRQVRVV
jgi:hypothetical protein